MDGREAAVIGLGIMLALVWGVGGRGGSKTHNLPPSCPGGSLTNASKDLL
jgi:hypothetical protein